MNNPFDVIEQNFSFLKKEIIEVKQMLRPLPDSPKDRQGGKKLAMEITGLSESSIYKKSMQNAIPCSRRGNRLWFSESELLKWLELGMPNWAEYKATQRINEHLKR